MAIAKSFSNITCNNISAESINGASTTKNSKELNGTHSENTDITVIQPANTIIANVTIVNSGTVDIKTASGNDNHLIMSIGRNEIGGIPDYNGIQPAQELLNQTNPPGLAITWPASVRLPIIISGVGQRENAFWPEVAASWTHPGLAIYISRLASITARELNFRFTPIQTDLASTSTITIICEFTAL